MPYHYLSTTKDTYQFITGTLKNHKKKLPILILKSFSWISPRLINDSNHQSFVSHCRQVQLLLFIT